MIRVALLALVACSSPSKPAPTKTEQPAAPLSREVLGAQFASEFATVLEGVADRMCACKDDACRARQGEVAMLWLRDMGLENDMDPSVPGIDACWKGRAEAAFRRANTASCVAATAAPACKPLPKPQLVTVNTWWTAKPACPGAGTLELIQLPGASLPVKAQCRDGNGNLGRYTQWHPNGSVLIDGAFDAEHRRHGRWRAYYVHGVMAWERTYDGGELDGDSRAAFSDGAPKEQGRMRRGKKFGPWSVWDERGQKATTYFDDGVEVSATQWESSGAKKLCTSDCMGPDAKRTVEYSVSAEKNYTKGQAALAAKQLEAAALYFMFIRSRFPYSKYTQLSEQAIETASADFAKLRTACTQSCAKCATTCKLGKELAQECADSCSKRFPDHANLPARGT